MVVEGTAMCQDCQAQHRHLTEETLRMTLESDPQQDGEALTRHVSAEVAELMRHGEQCPCERCAQRRHNAWTHRGLIPGLEEAIVQKSNRDGNGPDPGEKEAQE